MLVGDEFCCPNKWNSYHECTPYCRERWSKERVCLIDVMVVVGYNNSSASRS